MKERKLLAHILPIIFVLTFLLAPVGPAHASPGLDVDAYEPEGAMPAAPRYAWHTFYGTDIGRDLATGILSDAGGNLYLAGYSGASWNGPEGTAPLHAHSGGNDIVVLKLNSVGVYQWHTFFGSSGTDESFSISRDGGNNLYLTGRSDATWDGPDTEAPLHAHSAGSNHDTVVLKLNSAGVYQWHTFYGSEYDEIGMGITSDASGNLYGTGYGSGTWNGPAAETPIHAHSGGYDVFAFKLNSTGAYQWHTFYGAATYDDYANAIASDASGNVYVTGRSSVPWNGPGTCITPGTSPCPLNAYTDGDDFTVLKLDSAGAYQWHTFLGGSGNDTGYSIAGDAAGNVYVAGSSSGSWNGPGATAPQNAYAGNNDIVVLKLSSAGAYQWHTFHGSSFFDEATAITSDADGNLYVAGYGDSSWNGPALQVPLNAYNANFDITLLALDSAGAYKWHTFYGSTDNDFGLCVAGNLHVAGYSSTTWNGPGAAAPLNAFAGIEEITVIQHKFSRTYYSAGDLDGWILESGETTNAGGTKNALDTTLRLGDNGARKQFKSILSFNTSSLPDNAVLGSVTLKLKRQGITGGGNPVSMLQGFKVDTKTGTFDASALELSDFAAVASKSSGPFVIAPVSGWYNINLSGAKGYVNKLADSNGLTQMRLYFKLDDNNNAVANFISLYSGNAGTVLSRPRLIIEYYLP